MNEALILPIDEHGSATTTGESAIGLPSWTPGCDVEPSHRVVGAVAHLDDHEIVDHLKRRPPQQWSGSSLEHLGHPSLRTGRRVQRRDHTSVTELGAVLTQGHGALGKGHCQNVAHRQLDERRHPVLTAREGEVTNVKILSPARRPVRQRQCRHRSAGANKHHLTRRCDRSDIGTACVMDAPCDRAVFGGRLDNIVQNGAVRSHGHPRRTSISPQIHLICAGRRNTRIASASSGGKHQSGDK